MKNKRDGFGDPIGQGTNLRKNYETLYSTPIGGYLITKSHRGMTKCTSDEYGLTFYVDKENMDLVFRKGILEIKHPEVNPLEGLRMTEEEFTAKAMAVPDLLLFTFNRQNLAETLVHVKRNHNTELTQDFNRHSHGELLNPCFFEPHTNILKSIGFEIDASTVTTGNIDDIKYIISVCNVVGNYHIRCETIKNGVAATFSMISYGSEKNILSQLEAFNRMVTSVKFAQTHK